MNNISVSTYYFLHGISKAKLHIWEENRVYYTNKTSKPHKNAANPGSELTEALCSLTKLLENVKVHLDKIML